MDESLEPLLFSGIGLLSRQRAPLFWVSRRLALKTENADPSPSAELLHEVPQLPKMVRGGADRVQCGPASPARPAATASVDAAKVRANDRNIIEIRAQAAVQRMRRTRVRGHLSAEDEVETLPWLCLRGGRSPAASSSRPGLSYLGGIQTRCRP